MKRGSDRRKFTKEFKVEAVRLLDQPGMSVSKAAADLGGPANSMLCWHPAGGSPNTPPC